MSVKIVLIGVVLNNIVQRKGFTIHIDNHINLITNISNHLTHRRIYKKRYYFTMFTLFSHSFRFLEIKKVGQNGGF